MFGIGKVLHQVLDQHNLGDLSGRIDTESVETMRESIEALGASGEIGNVGGVLKDISAQLSGVLKDVGENLTHMADDIEVEVSDELVPHEAVQTLQGLAVEDDDIVATQTEAPVDTIDAAQAEEAGETTDD